MWFVEDVLLSKWHMITIILSLVALGALFAGGYHKKKIVRSTVITFLLFYFAISMPVWGNASEKQEIEEHLLTQLDVAFNQRLQEHSDLKENQMVTLMMGSWEDDGEHKNHIFVGNYSNSYEFNGWVQLLLYDSENKEFLTKTYENVRLKPNQKLKLDEFYTETYAKRFQYSYEEK
ncbi:hypothetical protein [Brevibacillus daliensis]|uniref:hypothetical protein n=1 Tax=Brevibacillus daliensis TaxID=2892995 RepID=UPI001E2B5C30|nr:hypothetical protein [Brevibacillus daliensis]